MDTRSAVAAYALWPPVPARPGCGVWPVAQCSPRRAWLLAVANTAPFKETGEENRCAFHRRPRGHTQRGGLNSKETKIINLVIDLGSWWPSQSVSRGRRARARGSGAGFAGDPGSHQRRPTTELLTPVAAGAPRRGSRTGMFLHLLSAVSPPEEPLAQQGARRGSTGDFNTPRGPATERESQVSVSVQSPCPIHMQKDGGRKQGHFQSRLKKNCHLCHQLERQY